MFVFPPVPLCPCPPPRQSDGYDAFITRGTTPTFFFTLPDELTESNIAEINISFSQNNEVVFSKDSETCSFMDEHTIVTTLEQEDTLALMAGDCWFQLKLKDSGGNVLASQIYKAKVDKILSDEVL